MTVIMTLLLMYDVPFECMLELSEFSDQDLYNIMYTCKTVFSKVFRYLDRTNRGKLTDLLIFALQKGNVLFFQEMIHQGINTDKGDKYGTTPLMHASQKGDTKIVEILINSKADVNKQNKSETTALMYASCEYNKEIVAMLIDAGANVNTENDIGKTALVYAAKQALVPPKLPVHKEIIEMLIENGSDTAKAWHWLHIQ